MKKELDEELAFAVGFDLIYHGDYFIPEMWDILVSKERLQMETHLI